MFHRTKFNAGSGIISTFIIPYYMYIELIGIMPANTLKSQQPKCIDEAVHGSNLFQKPLTIFYQSSDGWMMGIFQSFGSVN